MKAFKKTVTTNSLGFRGPEIDMSRDRIAILGDSITFGYSLEDSESIPAVLGELMPEHSVVNAAVPGYNLSQQTGVYSEKIATLEPSQLVLIFYWNDLGTQTAILHTDGTLRPPDWVPVDEECKPITTGVLGYIPGKCWLDLHSSFYRAVRKVVDGQEAKRRQVAQREESTNDPDADPVTTEKLETYQKELQALTALLPQKLPRLFVIWPDDNMHNISRPQLRSMATANGWDVLDLYDEFSNKAETLSYDRIHPSARTTKKAAELIYERLK